MPPTHCTACLRRWRMRRSSMTRLAAAPEGSQAPATGSSLWCPSSNLCSSRSSWLGSQCSCSKISTVKTRSSPRGPPEVSVGCESSDFVFFYFRFMSLGKNTMFTLQMQRGRVYIHCFWSQCSPASAVKSNLQ